MSKGKYYFSKSLEKGLKILSLFDGDTPVLTQSQIAKKLDLNMTSTYRYINTLEELGYLEKDAKTKEIRPDILCLILCNNLMQATDRLRLIKEAVDQVHRENNISIDVALVVDDTLRRLYHREDPGTQAILQQILHILQPFQSCQLFGEQSEGQDRPRPHSRSCQFPEKPLSLSLRIPRPGSYLRQHMCKSMH